VNNFDNVAKDTLDEWIYYFKNNALPERFRAKGLDKVEAQLKVDAMNAQEKIHYEAHLKSLAISHSMLETAKIEGKLGGKLEGEYKKGRYAASKLIMRGFANEDIAEITGLNLDAIESLRKEMN